ncbi:hypothetical protein [Roseibium sp.]|uniref:hypothetical protein n=1 Tax=Roseibium sp. TaxID=1936156 RepID=UPI0026034DB2|nr:hypothetical protein [Roseibium sp.]
MSIGSMPSLPHKRSKRHEAFSNLAARAEASTINLEDKNAFLDQMAAMYEALVAFYADHIADRSPAAFSPPPSIDELRANFEAMLADQVDTGTLTPEQADHLMGMFEDGEFGAPKASQAEGNSMKAGDSLMKTVLANLQTGFGYDDRGDQPSPGVKSMLADYRV